MKPSAPLLVIAIMMTTSLFSQKALPTDSVDVVIRLNNRSATAYSDSVLIIFDRYDHAGAGIVKKVYQPVNGVITIPNVPSGRYYIDIFCLGLHREVFSELTYVNNRHNNTFSYRVQKTSTSLPGLAAIPLEKIDMSKLHVLRAGR